MESKRFVVFAGAGISMGPPSALPSWWALNEWILSALHHRVSREFGIQLDFLKILIEYRGASHSYPPDYQAQFLEECAGLEYFQALTALDIDATNRCHQAIAALAKAGRLAAVVTTNFDCLIERALDVAGVPFDVACEAAGFTKLERALEVGAALPLPVIKVHGSTMAASSMVDTRKQRRKGRERALVNVLTHLLHRYSFLFAGFSGADLEQDRHYLGLWDAAALSPGFRFLFQPGTQPKNILVELCQHYGEKAKRDEIDAAEALEQLAGSVTSPSSGAGGSTTDLVQGRLQAWADGLDRWRALRMAAALQEAASMRVNALRLLRTVVQHQADGTTEHVLATADWVKARLRRARYDDIEMRTAIRFLVASDHPLGPYYQLLSDAALGSGTVREECLRFADAHSYVVEGWAPTAAVDAILLVAQASSFTASSLNSCLR